jgi:hypothetical protein
MVVLDSESIEAIARRVAQLLDERPTAPTGLVDATDLARLLGLARSTVYEHQHELGGIKLGEGDRPRLRFAPACVRSRMPLSRTVAPYSPARTPPASRRSGITGRIWAFHTGYQHDRGTQPPDPQDHQDPRQLPRRGLRPPAALPRDHHAQRKWRHTDNWSSALTALRIHFADRIPDNAL